MDGLTPIIKANVSRELRRRRPGRAAEHEVPDLIQRVLMLLFTGDQRALRQWDPERGLSLPGYVGMVARRATSGTLRSQRSEEPVAPEVMDESAALSADPEAEISEREIVARTAGLVREKLSPLGAEMFRLVFLDARPTDEICAATGATPETVYTWRTRLLRRVRELAAELLADPPCPANDTARVGATRAGT